MDDFEKKEITNFIIEEYLTRAVQAHYPKKHTHSVSKGFSIPCCYCDHLHSYTNTLKGSLYKTNKNNWAYNCWRSTCSCHDSNKSAMDWLKDVDPFLWEECKREIYEKTVKQDSPKMNYKKIVKEKIDEQKRLEILEKERNISVEQKAFTYFRPLNIDSELSRKAIQYCENRKIDKKYYNNFFVAVDGKYKNRLIIPVLNRDGEIIFWQGRLMEKKDGEAKYLNPKLNRDSLLFGIERMDIEKPVIVFEGPIDSLFVDNGVATMGVSIPHNIRELLNAIDQVFYVFDNDDAGREMSVKYLKDSKYVFNWFMFIRDHQLEKYKIKDMNDLYMVMNRDKPFSFDELKPYFTNSKYSSAYFMTYKIKQ